jgi:methionyl-tRNA formyltransferase
MNKIKVVYCGNIANVADEVFLSEHFVLKKVFIENKNFNSAMLTFCKLRDIPFEFVNNSDDLYVKVKNTKYIDCLLVCGFGIILSKSLINHIDAYNFHPGRLPNYKGRHPTFFATIDGNPTIDVTLHKITSKIDEGEIINVVPIKYRFNENEIDLQKKIYRSIEVMLPVLHKFLIGKIKSVIKPGGKYFSPVSLENKTFTKNDKISHILNIIRAQASYDGGIFNHGNEKYIVKSAEVNLINESLNSNDGIIYYQNSVIGIVIDKICWLKFTDIKKK